MAVLSGHWHSTGLIAVTQCEGIVWSYSHFLTAKGIRICKTVKDGRKTKYSPYLWDLTQGNYKDLRSSGRPRHQLVRPGRRNAGRPVTVNSARGLIEDTALHVVFPVELWDYLLNGFFDERNSLAHGKLLVTKRMAVQSLLCLYELIHSIDDFETRRLSGSNWRNT